MKDKQLYEYIELCKRIYERMERDNSWYWEKPSQKRDSEVDSKDTSKET